MTNRMLALTHLYTLREIPAFTIRRHWPTIESLTCDTCRLELEELGASLRK